MPTLFWKRCPNSPKTACTSLPRCWYSKLAPPLPLRLSVVWLAGDLPSLFTGRRQSWQAELIGGFRGLDDENKGVQTCAGVCAILVMLDLCTHAAVRQKYLTEALTARRSSRANRLQSADALLRLKIAQCQVEIGETKQALDTVRGNP